MVKLGRFSHEDKSKAPLNRVFYKNLSKKIDK